MTTRSIVRAARPLLCLAAWLAALGTASGTAAQGYAPTASFSYTSSFPEYVDIPGVAFGENAQDQDRLWVSAYCPNNDCPTSLGWGPGTVHEITPSSGVKVVHPSLGWGVTGPAGLAHDGAGFLWVAGYNEERLYKVRLSNWTLEDTIDLSFRPVGGLGIDDTGRLWITGQSDNMLRYDPTTETAVATYPNVFPKGGIDCIGPFVVVVWTTGVIEVRDQVDFDTVYATYAFPPANDPSCGGLTACGDFGIDPKTGYGYWGGRCEDNDQLYRVKVVDVGPSITSQPQPASRCAGTSVTFSVTATGDPAVQYQWFREAAAISGATSNSYTLANVQSGDDGVDFRCRVSNVAGSVFSAWARLTVLQPVVVNSATYTGPSGTPTPWPQLAYLCEGTTISLTVNASGPGLNYLWQRLSPSGTFTTLASGPAVTSISYTVTSADVTGPYVPSLLCSATGTCGGVSNLGMHFYVYRRPTITQHPQSATTSVGSPVTFTVAGSNIEDYQWQRNGASISGATGSSYTLSNPILADSGASFRCRVTNGTCAEVDSNAAVLTVLQPFGPPTGLAGCNSCGTCATGAVTLTWNPVSGATHYQVYRRTTNAPTGSTTISAWITATTFQDTTASPGVRYYYWVKAAASSSGLLASAFSASTTGWRPLAAPSGVFASDGTQNQSWVDVAWNPVQGASFYRVYRNRVSDPAGLANAEPVGDWTSATSLEDYGCLPNETHLYWVIASADSVGDLACAFSAPDSGWRPCVNPQTTSYGAPSAPGLLVLLDRSASMNVVRPSTGNLRCEDAMTMARQDVDDFFLAYPGGSVAIWTANGPCPSDRTQGFVDWGTAMAALDALELEPCEGASPLADSMHHAILKLFQTYAWAGAGQRILAVSSAGVESSSTGPSSGPDATSGTDCGTGFTYAPNPVLLPWQQKICDLLGNPVLDVVSVRMWDSLAALHASAEGSTVGGTTPALLASLAARSGGAFQRVADDGALPPSFVVDCNENGIVDQVEISQGAPDCNGNGVLDACDLMSGASTDSWPPGGDGIPDECQTRPGNVKQAGPARRL